MSRAADALSVTQSAVSHQIRNLESELGTRLFTRAGRRLKLTVDGERLYLSVRRTLADLRHDFENFTQERFDGELSVAAPPTFTTLWLLPRLAEFRERFPQLRYRFTTMPVPPASLPDADIIIQFGTQYWPDKRVVPLVDTNYLPVCAPQLLHGRRRFSPADLESEVIIHDDNGEAWDQWLAAMDLGGLEPREEIFVGKPIDALHMARMGYGFAINDDIITSNWIAAGDLIQPFRKSAESYDRFYIVSDYEQDMKPAAQEFESWLRRGIEGRVQPI
jgi:LysR family glycine cleavage system transcriptional activator